MKVRLEQHIRECLGSGQFAVRSERDHWDEVDCFALCSFGIFTRSEKTSYNDEHAYHIPKGSWILYRPYKVGWFWNQKWYIRCEKWNGTRFITVTGFTQQERDNLAELWLSYAPSKIQQEKQLIAEAKIDKSDQTAWHP